MPSDKLLLAVVGSRVEKRNRVGMYVASYLDSQIAAPGMPRDTYPELKGLPSLTLGCTPVLIDPNERDFLPVFSGGTGVMKRIPHMGPPAPEPTPPTPPTKRKRKPAPLALVPKDDKDAKDKPKSERKVRAA